MRAVREETANKAIALTAAFEGGGLAGNRDGQVISWGLLQWNVGQGTLLGVLKRIEELDPVKMATVMGWPFVAALESNETLRAFCLKHVLGRFDSPKAEWVHRFSSLAATGAAMQAFREHAQKYVEDATRDAVKLRLESERAFAFCFDIAVQNGGVRDDHMAAYWNFLENGAAEEWRHLKALAKAVAACANPRWHDDVLSRKLCIATRQGTVHGKAYDIERDFGVSHLERWYKEEAV